jgi:hypothetical protein
MAVKKVKKTKHQTKRDGILLRQKNVIEQKIPEHSPTCKVCMDSVEGEYKIM